MTFQTIYLRCDEAIYGVATKGALRANKGAAGAPNIGAVRATTGAGAATSGAVLATRGAATTWGVFLTTALNPLTGSAV